MLDGSFVFRGELFGFDTREDVANAHVAVLLGEVVVRVAQHQIARRGHADVLHRFHVLDFHASHVRETNGVVVALDVGLGGAAVVGRFGVIVHLRDDVVRPFVHALLTV